MLNRLNLLAMVLILSAPCVRAENTEEDIRVRIQPVGQVRVEGADNAPVVKDTQQSTPVKKEPGQEIYETHCITCHQNGLAGAPKHRNIDDWKPRLTEKSVDELVKSAISGLNAMPPKGTCSECSAEEIKQAILFMLPSHDN